MTTRRDPRDDEPSTNATTIPARRTTKCDARDDNLFSFQLVDLFQNPRIDCKDLDDANYKKVAIMSRCNPDPEILTEVGGPDGDRVVLVVDATKKEPCSSFWCTIR